MIGDMKDEEDDLEQLERFGKVRVELRGRTLAKLTSMIELR